MTTPSIQEQQSQVDGPAHYEGDACLNAMIEAFGPMAVVWFCRCNAFKYEWRAGKKDCVIQDLEKAIWYLNKEIELRTITPSMTLD